MPDTDTETDTDTDRPEWQTKMWLLREYWEKERSLADIAAEVGTYKSHVSYYMDKHNIPRRNQGRVPGDQRATDGGS